MGKCKKEGWGYNVQINALRSELNVGSGSGGARNSGGGGCGLCESFGDVIATKLKRSQKTQDPSRRCVHSSLQR